MSLPAEARPTRRHVIAAGAAATLLGQRSLAAAPLSPRGLVLPRAAAPAWTLVDQAGRPRPLSAMLRGRISCVQLMFAGCTATCPVQGAIFAALARSPLPSDVRLLSITVDPLGDGPQALTRWLERFGRHEIWSAAAPRPQDLDSLTAFLRGAPARQDTHSTQAFLFDRDARLAFRSVDMPAPEHLAQLLHQLADA